MRITDIALSTTTPVGTPRTGARRTESGSAGAPAPASAGRADAASHPDEIAAAALQKAAGAASAGRVVAAENQRAADSVRGEIDLSRVLQPTS